MNLQMYGVLQNSVIIIEMTLVLNVVMKKFCDCGNLGIFIYHSF